MSDVSDSDNSIKHSNQAVCAYISWVFYKDHPFTVQQLEEKVTTHNLWKPGEEEASTIVIHGNGKVLTATLRSLLWALKNKNLLVETQERGIYQLKREETCAFLKQYAHFPKEAAWLASLENRILETPRRAAVTLLHLKRHPVTHQTQELTDDHSCKIIFSLSVSFIVFIQ